MEESLRILILEDSDLDAAWIMRHLREQGVTGEFQQVTRLDTFREVLKSDIWDLILSDYRMDGFTAADALEVVQQQGLDIPFIVISGLMGEDTAVTLMKDGAHDILSKDSLARLTAIINREIREAVNRRQRRQTEAALKDSQARLQLVIESATDAILTLDESHIITYANQAAEKVFKTNVQQLEGRPVQAFLLDEAAAILGIAVGPVRATSAGNQVPQANPTGLYHFLARRHDGEIFPAEVSISRAQVDQQCVFTLILRDVGDRDRIEKQIRQGQRMDAIGILSGKIAHGFNDILTELQLTLAVMQNRHNLSDETLRQIQEMGDATSRAAQLTQQLLMFSRRDVEISAAVDVSESIQELQPMLRRIVGDRVALNLQLATLLPPIPGDRQMIEQVVMNLADNARDAMPAGGEFTVSTSLVELKNGSSYLRYVAEARPGVFVRLSVRDTGNGIQPEHISHIFEPFFTTKDTGKGTGLGLATTYGIVKQHQGWIDVNSKLGHGTSFDVFLPTNRLPEERCAEARMTKESIVKVEGGGETIFVVEDEPMVRRLVEMVLIRLGYQVITARDGPTALDLWERRGMTASLVLTDLIMPGGMTGRDLACRLVQLKPDLKVVYTSGHKELLPDLDPPLVEGVNFLQKPYSSDRLARLIRRSLDTPPPASPLNSVQDILS